MNIVIFGATSAIAQAWAQNNAKGNQLYLIARSENKLAQVAADLQVRGAVVHQLNLDMAKEQDYRAVIDQAYHVLGQVDIALFAQGSLPDQRELEKQQELVPEMMQLNTMSYLLPASLIGERMAVNGRGCLVLISSVAGDIGRQSNYFYGASKACVSTFAHGLRNHLFKFGVHVLTVKPGFVDSPMTAHLPNRTGPLWAKPEKIAADIDCAIAKKKNQLYTPWFWQIILGVIRCVPECIFKRLSL